MKSFCKFILLFLIHSNCLASHKVVVSISPVASIVSMLLGDKVQVTTLANSNSCPHNHAAKLSDLSYVESADINIYINKNFDQFAAKLMDNTTKLTIKLGDISGLKIIHNNTTPNWHLWLDLENVKVLLQELSIVFINQFPELKQYITKNLENSLLRIDDLINTRSKIFSDPISIMIFSDSLEYFFNYNNNIIKNNNLLSRNISYISKFQNVLRENPNLKCLIFSTEQDTTFYNRYNKKIIKLESENWHLSSDLPNLYFVKYKEMLQLIEQCK